VEGVDGDALRPGVLDQSFHSWWTGSCFEIETGVKSEQHMNQRSIQLRVWTVAIMAIALTVGVSCVSAQHSESPSTADKTTHAEHDAAASHDEAGHGGHGSESPSVFSGDLGNAFWTLIIFFVLLFVLGKFAWKPVLTALQNREKFITESLETAKIERERTEKMLKEFDEKVRQARKEASDTVEEALRDAEALRKRIHEDAQREAAEMISRAQRDIKLAQEKAVASIYHESVEIAANLAGKIVRKQLNPADHRALLDESLAEIGKLKP